MLRALFSKRYLQQLFREGKLLNERIYLYSTLLYFFTFPSMALTFFQLCIPETKISMPSPLLFYVLTFTGFALLFVTSHVFLWYFTTIFNYQEHRQLYATTKTLYRFYNAILLLCIIPLVWFTRTCEIIYFAYIPLFLTIFLSFFIHFLRNITGISRIQFFIYFCTLEILPYLLLAKLLIINL
jgi:hypothetical protein